MRKIVSLTIFVIISLFTFEVSLAGITINTNASSLAMQNELGKTQQALQKSFQRLSSGLRINKASDDATGLGLKVSEKINSELKNTTAASRDISDGITTLKMMEDVYTEISKTLVKINTLVSSPSINKSQGEFRALRNTLDRLAIKANSISKETRPSTETEQMRILMSQVSTNAKTVTTKADSFFDIFFSVTTSQKSKTVATQIFTKSIETASSQINSAEKTAVSQAKALNKRILNVVKNTDQTILNLEKRGAITIFQPSRVEPIPVTKAPTSWFSNIVNFFTIKSRVTPINKSSDAPNDETKDRVKFQVGLDATPQDTIRVEFGGVTASSLPITIPPTSRGTQVVIPLPIRSKGQCADGSCSESTTGVTGKFDNSTNNTPAATKPLTVPPTTPSTFAIGITLDSKIINTEITEGNVVQLKAIVRLSNGTTKDVTKEATWQIVGPIGSISQGLFTPKLDDSISEYGEYYGAILVNWKDQTSGKVFSISTQPFKVKLKFDENTEIGG